jgi:hypothetical protein
MKTLPRNVKEDFKRLGFLPTIMGKYDTKLHLFPRIIAPKSPNGKGTSKVYCLFDENIGRTKKNNKKTQILYFLINCEEHRQLKSQLRYQTN